MSTTALNTEDGQTQRSHCKESGLPEEAMETLPGIPEFYYQQSIFITGGSGLMGKVLIEKLLRSCPGIEKIFLLLRTKKGKDPSSRMEDIISSPLFDRLKTENPRGVSKLVAVAGDVMQLDLGLTREDRQMLEREVSIVFHVAASVRFNDPLQDAVFMNVRGTLQTVQLATSMDKLKVFVHVSTTYCNTETEVIEEQIYPPPADWMKTIQMAEQFDRDILTVIGPKYIGKKPNTYTFTKALAEQVVNDYSTQIPVVIFRPSIVISSVKEPMPGWIDNFNGPIGMLAAGGMGILHVSLAGPEVVADYMPVDVAIKAMIIAACHRGVDQSEPSGPKVYNCSQCGSMEISMGKLCDLGLAIVEEYPLQDSIWVPTSMVTESRVLFYFITFIAQFLPALLIDTVLHATGRKKRLLKLQKRILEANLLVAYFRTQEWKFINTNFLALREKLLPRDMETFYFGLENVDFYDYIKNASAGIQKFLLKEVEDLPRAKAHHFKMKLLDRFVRLVAICFLLWFVKRSSLAAYVSSTVATIYQASVSGLASVHNHSIP